MGSENKTSHKVTTELFLPNPFFVLELHRGSPVYRRANGTLGKAIMFSPAESTSPVVAAAPALLTAEKLKGDSVHHMTRRSRRPRRPE